MAAACGFFTSLGASAMPSAETVVGVSQDLTRRIRLVIAKVQQSLPVNSYLEYVKDPISLSSISDPVETNCGHVFSRVLLTEWRKKERPCPVCRAPIRAIKQPTRMLIDLIEQLHKEERVPTFPQGCSKNQRLAQCFLETAKVCMEESQRAPSQDKKAFAESALDAYREAFKHDQSSEYYARIPEIYDQLGDSDKANLSRLYLSVYQIQEQKILQALGTLKSIHSEEIDVGFVIVQLSLFDPTSQEALPEAIEYTSKLTSLEDRCILYNHILEIDPYQFSVYESLIALTQDLEKKNALLLQGGKCAKLVGQDLLATTFFNRLVLTKALWSHPILQNLPGYPKELEEFLEGECLFTPGHIRRETHIIFPIFPKVGLGLDGQTAVSLDLRTLGTLDKSTQGIGLRGLSPVLFPDMGVAQEFCWGVMYRDVIQGSQNEHVRKQRLRIPPGYAVPTAFEAALALLWNNRQPEKQRCFGDDRFTMTRCQEEIDNRNLAVGALNREGLCVYTACDYVGVGMSAVRKFKA